MDNQKVSAIQVIKAIATRHKNDMCFTEVKDGPTQTVRNHSKIDALAIRISWTNSAIIGYEVKVSRSDFLRDEKWRSYLPMCNQLYFAVAPGIVDKSEIPDCCGLVQMTSTGGLRTIKKAPFREIEEPTDMYKYLMFSYIGPRNLAERNAPQGVRLLHEMTLDRWREYLDDKKAYGLVGHEVAIKRSAEVRELERKADRAEQLERQNQQLREDMHKIIASLGVNPYALGSGAEAGRSGQGSARSKSG